MTVERRLRDAMQARVEGVDAPAMAVRPERTRRVWPAVAAGFAIVLVVALAVALIARDDGGDDPIRPVSTPYPARIVVLTTDGRVEVRSATDGHVVRLLASDAQPSGGLSVAPDGRSVYYSQLLNSVCASTPATSATAVARVSVMGGTPERVASYSQLPTVSPDGRWLAYTGLTGCSDAGNAIVVKDLRRDSGSPYDERWDAPATSSTGQPMAMTSLSWGPDSHHLAFESAIDGYPRILDTDSSIELDAAPRVEIEDGTMWFGYRGMAGGFLGFRFASVRPANAVALDEAGVPTAQLFAAQSAMPVALRSDASGANLLFVQSVQSTLGLYRWSQLTGKLVRLDLGVRDAAWLGEAASSKDPKQATKHPSKVVAVTNDGRLVVVSAHDGHILRNLADDAVASNGLSVSPDGRTVYYARDTGGRCSTGDPITTIASMSIDGGAPTDLASNVRFPAVSPDGRYLAFTGIPNCSDAGRSILLRDLTVDAHTNGSYDQWWTVSDEATSPWLSVQSLSWASDSRQILFTHASKSGAPPDDGGPRLLDTGAGFSTSLDTSPVVPVGPGVVCCTMGSTGPAYGTTLDAKGFAGDVVTVNVDTGKAGRRLTCCGEVIAVDAGGRSLLIHFTDTDHPGGIYRWSPGAGKPTLLGSLLFAAVWLPGS